MNAVVGSKRVGNQVDRLARIVEELPTELAPIPGDLPFIAALMAWEQAEYRLVPYPDRISTRLCTVAQEAKPADPAVFVERFLKDLPSVRSGRFGVLDARNRATAWPSIDEVRNRHERIVFDPMVMPKGAAPVPPPPTSTVDPDTIEALMAYAERAVGRPATKPARRTLETAIVVALEVLERYPDARLLSRRPRDGTSPAVRSMQADNGGRREGRLSLVLTQHMPKVAAVSATRLLAGWRGDERRSLLVHAAIPTPVSALARPVVAEWDRDLAVLDPSLWADAQHRKQVRDAISRRHRTAPRPAEPLAAPTPAMAM